MSDNDDGSDWFEDALEEADAESDEADEDSGFDADAVSGDVDAEDSGGVEDTGTTSQPAETDDESPFGDSDTPFGESEGDSAFGGSEDDTPFEDGDDSPFGDSEGDSPFDEDFGSAFGAAEDDEFGDEDVESSLTRIDLGIEGLDQMIQGGIPDRHLMTAIGSAGTGKTTFGLQFLQHGLQQGDSGVFITLEQSREDIVATADDWGWEFARYEDDDTLAIVDLDPVEMANSLDNIRGELPELIRDFGADRLVLDSVSLLEMMYEDQARRRTEVFDFTRSLKQAGVTTFLTSEASETNPYASRHGIIEYLTDAVFVLQYVRGESQETRLAVEIQKIRNTNHSREMKPYEITSDGLFVYQQANIF